MFYCPVEIPMMPSSPPEDSKSTKSSGDGKGKYAILDDFSYNNNVASAHVYIR
jgi:hypothetical protein